MTFRQKLTTDIHNYFKQCKWQQQLHDHLTQLLQMRPQSPYDYIEKKISLRSKLDNTKYSSFLSQLLIYCLFVNPLQISQSQIQNKILYLCVEKYQHSKIRKNDTINIINGLLLLTEQAPTNQKQKQYYIKLITQQIQTQTVNTCYLARLLYCTILFMAMRKQIQELDQKLRQIQQSINIKVMEDYLQAVDSCTSMLKKMNVKLDGDGDLYKNIAVVALEVQNDS